MKQPGIVFLRWTALLLVIGLTIFGLLLSLPTQKPMQTDTNLSSQPGYVSTLNRTRAEFRI